jgi:hypothetical protein
MSGTSYSSSDELISAVIEQIASVPKDQLVSIYKNWIKRFNWGTEHRREYYCKWVKVRRTDYYIDQNRRLLRTLWPAQYEINPCLRFTFLKFCNISSSVSTLFIFLSPQGRITLLRSTSPLMHSTRHHPIWSHKEEKTKGGHTGQRKRRRNWRGNGGWW